MKKAITPKRGPAKGAAALPCVTSPPFLDDERIQLLLFGGKGGVGKTTCATAAAMGYAANHPQAAVVVVSTDPAHSLADCVAGASLPPNLEAVELDASECLERFKTSHLAKLRIIGQRGTFFDDQDIDEALGLSLPGMDEVMAFLQIMRWVDDGHHDRIIVDTAPTGHTLRLLAMPDTLRTWLDALDTFLAKYRYMKRLLSGSYRHDEVDIFLEEMATSVGRLEVLLGNMERCRFVPVMLAEALSILETTDLVTELGRSKVAFADIVVNRLSPTSACALCTTTHNHQVEQLSDVLFHNRRLRKCALWGVPLYEQEQRGSETLTAFWDGAVRLLPEVVQTKVATVQQDSNILLPKEEHLVANPAPLPDRRTRLLMFAGKGGVGKTTLASATALRLAKEWPDRNILLVSVDPAHSLSACFDLKILSKPTAICQGLSALEVDAQSEFDALKKQYIKELRQLFAFSRNIDIQFDKETVSRLLDLAPPGLDEAMALTRLMKQLSGARHDVIVLDTAPTGHLLRLLELPQIIEQWLKFIFGLFLKYRRVLRFTASVERLVNLSKNLKALRKLLVDPDQAALYLVTIPTEMALAETRDLDSAARHMGINAPVLFINMVTPDGEDCPLCRAVAKREARVTKEFDQFFGDHHRTLVYRDGAPRRIGPLTALGMGVYRREDGVTSRGRKK